jgi:hypothetical protein
MRRVIGLILAALVLTGCETLETQPSVSDEPRRKPAAKRSADALLASGIREFEEGNYGPSERLLRSSIGEGLPTRAGLARAHKYLAFIYCVTNRITQCREEFGHALRADPKFALTAAEAGHPTWGPAFRSVSQGR